ncbi:MAG TPA: hypothetical protein VIX37_06150, partial [Candidatus Sulfotelmatobacter sp.]
MPFQVHLATAAGATIGPMSLTIESSAFPAGASLPFGSPGTVLPVHSIQTIPGTFFPVGLLFEVWGDKSTVQLNDAGADDVLTIIALPNSVPNSPNLGAFFVGNLHHIT